MGIFSAESKSRSASDSSTKQLTAGDASILTTLQAGQRSTIIGPGSNAYTLGRGATLNITNQGGDNSAIERAVKAQSENTAAALKAIGSLTKTSVVDAATTSANSTQYALYAAGAVAVLVALFYCFKR